MAYNNRTTLTVAPRKPLNLNCSLTEKSLMCGSLNGQPIAEPNYHFKIGDNYDETRISTLQSNEEIKIDLKITVPLNQIEDVRPLIGERIDIKVPDLE